MSKDEVPERGEASPVSDAASARVWWPTRLLGPYRPVREWIAWRIAELISPLSFRGRRVTRG